MLYMYYSTSMSAHKTPETKIYNRLKVLRAERGISRKQLAEELGVNYQTVGYIERGEYNPSLELAFRASEFFRVPIEAVFSRKPFKPLSEEVYGVRDVETTQPIKGGNVVEGGSKR